MATILKRLEFRKNYADYQQGLFVVLEEKRLPKGQDVVNIGKTLSEKLCTVPREQRANEAPKILEGAVLPFRAISLNHLEILFTGYLRYDVIREIRSLCRNRKICILWPGEYRDGKLTYAEPALPEFYECDANGLTDTYIITE